jgi:hypothetical protein
MPRGGKREGTPGKAYANRTDMGMNYDNAGSSAASGGVAPPPAAPVSAGPPAQTPEDSPNLSSPTAYPDEPITAGLPIGAGPGPSRDTRMTETVELKRFLPFLEPYLDRPDTPDSVRALFRYIRGS